MNEDKPPADGPQYRGLVGTADGARDLAAHQLARALPRRWLHVQGVAARADALCVEIGIVDRRLVIGAWLHDIGYAPEFVDTGFHALDGARFLLSVGADPMVASLVAHHSHAEVEASVRGLVKELNSEFDKPPAFMADALCYCDMTTGPDGVYVCVHDRLAEIRRRYGREAVVTRFIDHAAPHIVAAVERVQRLRASA